MRRKILASCAAASAIWLAGCNSQDVSNLQSDTRQLGKDMAPIVTGAALQTKVVTSLSMHKGIDMSGLHIETSGRTVTVGGHVRDNGMRKKVINAVNETTGVEHVVDKLNIEK